MVYEDRARGMTEVQWLSDRIIAVELCDCNAGMESIFFWKLENRLEKRNGFGFSIFHLFFVF